MLHIQHQRKIVLLILAVVGLIRREQLEGCIIADPRLRSTRSHFRQFLALFGNLLHEALIFLRGRGIIRHIDRADVHAVDKTRRAADMVLVIVCNHQGVDRVNALCCQELLNVLAVALVSGIDDCDAVCSLNHHRVSLADVKDRDGDVAGDRGDIRLADGTLPAAAVLSGASGQQCCCRRENHSKALPFDSEWHRSVPPFGC